jgi:hypothetical protein
MAKVYLNPIFKGISGRLGDFMYRQVSGRTVACYCPRGLARPPSAAQLANRERFAASARVRAAKRNLASSVHRP